MKVTREVILDLYPLFRDGEASEDTRLLVQEFLEADPDLGKLLAHDAEAGLPDADLSAPASDAEMATLTLAKRLIRMRSALMGLAIFATMLPFSFRPSRGSVEWVFLGAAPLAAGMLVAAAGLWVAYAAVNRRLSGTGL